MPQALYMEFPGNGCALETRVLSRLLCYPQIFSDLKLLLNHSIQARARDKTLKSKNIGTLVTHGAAAAL